MITVKFSKSYDNALTQAYLFHSGLVRDLSLFTAYSPMFDATYAGYFLDLITDAGSLPINEEDLNNQVILSLEVESKMEESRALYKKLISYVNLKWGVSESVLRAFGNNLFEKARKSPTKMINLLELANRTADSANYKADLIALGFIQLDITALLTLSGELHTAYKNQQEFIQYSSDRAEQRIIAFNKFWDEMVKINYASRIVFKDSPALIKYYMLYPEGEGPGLLIAPENLTYDQVSGRISWEPVGNSTSYRIEIKFGEVFEEIYADIATETYYIPPSSPSNFVIHAMARNAGGLGPVSPLTVDYDPPLQPPGYISLTVVNAPAGAIALNWEEVPLSTFFRLYHSQVALGTVAGVYDLVGEYNIASYSGTVPTGYRHWFHVIAGSSEKLSVASDAIYVDMPLVP